MKYGTGCLLEMSPVCCHCCSHGETRKRRDGMPPGDASSVLSLLWLWRDHEVRDGMPPGDESSVLSLL